MPFSFLDHLACPHCHALYAADQLNQLCTCGSPLLARYDLDAARLYFHKTQLQSRSPDLWRYHELLPVRSPEQIVSLGEGMTPIVPLRNIGVETGLEHLDLKDEGLMPTGSFKARGAAVGVSRAKELGVRVLAM